MLNLWKGLCSFLSAINAALFGGALNEIDVHMLFLSNLSRRQEEEDRDFFVDSEDDPVGYDEERD